MLLVPYRVLDLTDEKGFFCGKILGDLGADVIKVERVGGDLARSRGPFFHDIADIEKSLYWFAYNTNKKGITLNLEVADGREIFKRLVDSADIIVESFPVGYMDSLGLGYSVLSERNPNIILTSISPFGQKSSLRHYKANDLIAQAQSTVVYVTGDIDRPPVMLGAEQAYVQAGANAAAATMIALYQRGTSGEGQHVDVSMVESMAWGATACLTFAHWELEGYNMPRMGTETRRGHVILKQMYPCQDGYVRWRILTGTMGRRTRSMVEWMNEQGMGDDSINIDWGKIDLVQTDQNDIDRWELVFTRFFLLHTKSELYEEAVKRSVMLFPVTTPKDILESRQIEFREYFTNVEHPELRGSILYPGPLFRSSEGSPGIRFRAPLVGEHNEEIYGGELGLNKNQILLLKEATVI